VASPSILKPNLPSVLTLFKLVAAPDPPPRFTASPFEFPRYSHSFFSSPARLFGSRLTFSRTASNRLGFPRHRPISRPLHVELTSPSILPSFRTFPFSVSPFFSSLVVFFLCDGAPVASDPVRFAPLRQIRGRPLDKTFPVLPLKQPELCIFVSPEEGRASRLVVAFPHSRPSSSPCGPAPLRASLLSNSRIRFIVVLYFSLICFCSRSSFLRAFFSLQLLAFLSSAAVCVLAGRQEEGR